MTGAAILEAPAGAQGLEERFEAFVEVHRERAYRLAWRLVGGDDAAAEDVTQEAFLRAARALRGFRGEARLETWFTRILIRQAASYRRWRGLRELWGGVQQLDAADPLPRPQGDPALRDRIAAALEKLTRCQRECFVLVHLEGWCVREAAELLGKPEGTVKSHLARALRQLRLELSDLRAAPSGGQR